MGELRRNLCGWNKISVVAVAFLAMARIIAWISQAAIDSAKM